MFVCPNLVIMLPVTITCRFHCPLQTKNCSSTSSLILVAQIVHMKEGEENQLLLLLNTMFTCLHISVVFLLKPPQSPHCIVFRPKPQPSHFLCSPSTSTTTIRFLLLFHHHLHHLISIVVRPPPTHFVFPPSL